MPTDPVALAAAVAAAVESEFTTQFGGTPPATTSAIADAMGASVAAVAAPVASAIDAAASGGGGTVTSITAGTGLTGGTITTSGTIAADFGTGSGKVTQGNDSRLPPAPSTAGRTLYDSGSAWVALAGASYPGMALGWSAAGLPAWLNPLQSFLLGDGRDGALAVSAGTYSFSSLEMHTDVTLSGTGTLNPVGYPVLCLGKFHGQSGGTLTGKGGDASGATGGTGVSSGFLIGVANAPSGTTGTGTSTAAQTDALGGSGGAGGSGAAGAGGSTATASQAATRGHRAWGPSIVNFAASQGLTFGTWRGGLSGSSGAGDGASKKGGGAGVGGRQIIIIANEVELDSGFTIDIRGGNGGNGETAGGNTGGGGGGGAGWVRFICRKFTDNGATWQTTGGTGGTASGGVNGSAGGNAGTGRNALAGSSTTGYDVIVL